jgi:methylmalonyl-CoA mutase cobalamin-binding subunit
VHETALIQSDTELAGLEVREKGSLAGHIPATIARAVRQDGSPVIDLAELSLKSLTCIPCQLISGEGATVVGLSALLTTTMTGMRDVVELVRSRGLQDTVKVIVGGAPLSRSFADDIGADAYGFDAANAVERIRELTGG